MNKKGTQEEGQEMERGIIYYLRGSKLVGVLLWNASDMLENARQLLHGQPDVVCADTLKRSISMGPENWLQVVECDKSKTESST